MSNTINVQAIDMLVDVFGTARRIFPTLIWDDEGATLVDAMFPGNFDQLKQGIEQAGVSFQKLKRVIITHQDWDHIGTLSEILAAGKGQIELWVHVDEKPYLEGTIHYLKMTPERIASMLKTVPEGLRDDAAAMLSKIPTASVQRVLEDGEMLPIHGGLKVIHTPGHSPGHICLYLAAERLLIAGDQLQVENGQLLGPSEIYSLDLHAALNSLKKLVGYDIDRVICYHGGVYTNNATASISALVSVI